MINEQCVVDPRNTRLASIDETVRFIINSHNYTEFDLTRPDFCGIYDCIDPRNVVRGMVAGTSSRRIKTAYQTAGGGAGVVDDRALYETVKSDDVVSVQKALEIEKNARGATVLDVHSMCKFITAISDVKQEMANPSDVTMDGVERTLFAHRPSEKEQILHLMPELQTAAVLQLEEMENYGMHPGVLEIFDEGYPAHANVKDVFGDNRASVYVINHSQRAGLDRNNKARMLVEQNTDIQFYHESRGAAFADYVRLYGSATEIMSGPDLHFMLGAFTLRSCATETVLCDLNPTEVWEVTHNTVGLHFAPIRST